MTPKTTTTTLKSAQIAGSKSLHLGSQKTCMSRIGHYRVLPQSTGLSTSLENNAEVPDQQIPKTHKLSYLLTSSFPYLPPG